MCDDERHRTPPDDTDVTRAALPSDEPGEQIGRYRLLQKIGEGGMGEVWVAEQREPIRRTVALKVIKVGMDTRQVVARFDAERQALALMDHPAIAKVLDAGATARGRPYFVMEYVPGEPLTAYCDRQRLVTRERLALFMRVCEGVQHAHQKGIIHRDLKPSNVLVTLQDGQPVPKIIDFGIAKATTQHLTERTLYTELGVLIGTPEYMSPEQAEPTGLDIDTRSDVYALGVLLYELLCGTLPFDRKALGEMALDEIRRTIREVDPPKPSMRVTQMGPASTEAARNRQTEVHRLASELRGDLDWITMKCLEKDRARRYGSASDLAADVKRHLDLQPVLASPPSAVYRIRKFVRRHRFGVTAAATVAVLLLALAVTMAAQARRIARERDRANSEAARANQEANASRQVSDFLVEVFRVSDPSEARGSAITAREVLDKGALRIKSELGSQPEVQARLTEVMARVYLNLGIYPQAKALAQQSWELRRAVLGPRHPDTLVSLNLVGVVAVQQGDVAAAERAFRESSEGATTVLGNSHPQTLTWTDNLAGVMAMRGKVAEAEQLEREILRRRRDSLGNDHRETLQSINNLASLLIEEGKTAEAESLLREGVAASRRTLGNDHPETLTQIGNLGELLQREGKLLEAEPYLREALTGSLRVLPPQHPATVYVQVVLAGLLNASARFQEAEGILREAIKAEGSAGKAILALADSLVGQHRPAEAERLLLAGYAEQSARGGGSAPSSQGIAQRLAALYESWGKPAKAAEWRKRLPASR